MIKKKAIQPSTQLMFVRDLRSLLLEEPQSNDSDQTGQAEAASVIPDKITRHLEQGSSKNFYILIGYLHQLLETNTLAQKITSFGTIITVLENFHKNQGLKIELVCRIHGLLDEMTMIRKLLHTPYFQKIYENSDPKSFASLRDRLDALEEGLTHFSPLHTQILDSHQRIEKYVLFLERHQETLETQDPDQGGMAYYQEYSDRVCIISDTYIVEKSAAEARFIDRNPGVLTHALLSDFHTRCELRFAFYRTLPNQVKNEWVRLTDSYHEKIKKLKQGGSNTLAIATLKEIFTLLRKQLPGKRPMDYMYIHAKLAEHFMDYNSSHTLRNNLLHLRVVSPMMRIFKDIPSMSNGRTLQLKELEEHIDTALKNFRELNCFVMTPEELASDFEVLKMMSTLARTMQYTLAGDLQYHETMQQHADEIDRRLEPLLTNKAAEKTSNNTANQQAVEKSFIIQSLAATAVAQQRRISFIKILLEQHKNNPTKIVNNQELARKYFQYCLKLSPCEVGTPTLAIYIAEYIKAVSIHLGKQPDNPLITSLSWVLSDEVLESLQVLKGSELSAAVTEHIDKARDLLMHDNLFGFQNLQLDNPVFHTHILTSIIRSYSMFTDYKSNSSLTAVITELHEQLSGRCEAYIHQAWKAAY